MNSPALAVALATAPSSAFAELRERPKFWFPLLLVVISMAVITYWYYSVVDIEWFKDLAFGNNPSLTEQQRAGAMQMMTRTTMTWSSVASVVLAFPIGFLIGAVIWLVTGMVTKVKLGFKHWFALACWTSLPIVLNCVVAAVLLLIRDTSQLDPGVTQPLSLNELVFHLPMGSPGQSLIASLGIPAFLTWALAIIGVHVWSQRSWLFSTLFVMVPTAIFYGIWAIIAFK